MAEALPRVCVIDDDSGIRESLRLILEDGGYEVVEAENGLVALALLRDDSRPYVVLLDRMMPRLDGEQTLRRLRAEPRDVWGRLIVIFMTARNDAPDPQLAELIASSTFATVAKPFDLDALLATVKRASESLAEHSTETYHEQ